MNFFHADEQGYGDLSAVPLLVKPAAWRVDLCRQPIGSRRHHQDNDLSGPDWVRKYFPEKVNHPFSEAHLAIWAWAERVTPDYVPPFLGICMPRGGGKTTTIEEVFIWWLAMGLRDFVVYVNSSLTKSAERLKSIQAMMEKPSFRSQYADLCTPAVGPRGVLAGWSVRRMRTTSGQFIAGASLDPKTTRGMIERGKRPDALCLDDLDAIADSAEIIAKKDRAVQLDILPIGGDSGMAVLFAQNLIHPKSLMSSFMDGTAEWSHGAERVGPIPAIRGLKYETTIQEIQTAGAPVMRPRHRITAGVATWAGQPIEVCQHMIDTGGLHAFLSENQHQMRDLKGAMWTSAMFKHLDEKPPLETYDWRAVAVDPSGGADVVGCIGGGIIFPPPVARKHEAHVERILREMRGEDLPAQHQAAPIVHLLTDRSIEPDEHGSWARSVCLAAEEIRADVIFVEANYGAGMALQAVADAQAQLVREGIITSCPEILPLWADQSKEDRADPVVQAYLDGRIWHAPGLDRLELEQTTWIPPASGQRGRKSPNRIDAAVHLVNGVMGLGWR